MGEPGQCPSAITRCLTPWGQSRSTRSSGWFARLSPPLTRLPLGRAGPSASAPRHRLIPAVLGVALAVPLGGLVAAAAIATFGVDPSTGGANGSARVGLELLGAGLAVDVAALAVLRVILTGRGAASPGRAVLTEMAGIYGRTEPAAEDSARRSPGRRPG